jgi:iron complex outermembrane receptor protein
MMRTALEQERLVPRSLVTAWLFTAAHSHAQTTAPEIPAPKPDEAPARVVVEGAREPSGVRTKEFNAGVLGTMPLSELPFSANIITRELIDKQQATYIGDVLKNDPSVSIGNVAVPFLLLRGYTVGTDGSLYDGLPGDGGLSDGRVGMQAIHQVQVFKGASALLFGVGAAGSLGGIINYLPKRPTDGPVREVGIGFANRSLWSIDADLGDRVGEDKQFGYRVNLGYRDGEQAVARYGWEQKVASVALDWRAAQGLVFNFNYDHIENQNPELPPFYFIPNPTLAVPSAPDTKRSAALSWDDFKVRSDNTYLRSDWAFAPNWSLTVQGMHNHKARPGTNQARFGSINNAAGDISLFGGQEISSEITNTGQLLVHGSFDTASIRHRVTLGLTGSKMESSGNFAPIINTADPFGVFPSNLYQPVDTPLSSPTSPLANLPSGKVSARSALVSDTIAFSEQWSMLLGVRRSSLTQDNRDAAGAVTSTSKNEKTLPTAALMFKPTPAGLVYLNYAQGMEQGGSVSPLGGAPFLLPRETKQVELGAKWDLGGLGVTAALFDMKRPLETIDVATGQNLQLGQQRHRGLELMASGRATPALSIVSGLMWIDASVEDSGDPAFDGKRAPGVPRITANAWGEYRIAPVPGLSINGGVFYQGKAYLDRSNLQPVPSWTRLDLGASYDMLIANLPTRFLLTVENATGKDYWASSLGGVLTMADPLTVKLGARVSF